MPVTIDELNEKYGKEDQNWNFKLFPAWLSKKGVPANIATETLKHVLADYSLDTLPDKHHEFDNEVLWKAKELNSTSEEILIKSLEASLNEKFKNYEADWNSLGKMKKIWEVVRGRA